MVIITVVCTVAVYLGMDSIVTSPFERELEIYFWGGEVDEDALKREVAALAEKNQVGVEEELSYTYVEVRPYKEGNSFRTGGEFDDYRSNWPAVMLMTQEEYNLLEGADESLASGEVLIFCNGIDFGDDKVYFGELEYSVKRELFTSRLLTKVGYNAMNTTYIIVFSDRDQVAQVSAVFGVDGVEGISYFYAFWPVGEEAQIDAFSRELEQFVGGQRGFAQYEDYREWEQEQESMYGSLLFIGIFFGAIFLICLLIIMYYKQITEGFEDRKNFEVMQKVGMSDMEIHRTIKKQIRMVFVLVYSFSYKRTSAAYYRIVK